jgi:hypothetical protein
LIFVLMPAVAWALDFGFEKSQGFAVGPADGTPANGPDRFAASSGKGTLRFSIAPSGGVGGGQSLTMNPTVTKNFETLFVPLAPADYGEEQGLPCRLFRIGVSARRSPVLATRADPDVMFYWGVAGRFRMVRLGGSAVGELLVYEHNRIIPTVIPNVFGEQYRRIEAVVNFPYRTYKLLIDGQPQLGGRDILFATPGEPEGALQVGFGAMVLGPQYWFDDFKVNVEPGSPIIQPPPPSAQPDDAIVLQANSLPPYNINPKYWQDSEAARIACQGGIDVNWYVAFKTAYPNVPRFVRPDGSTVLRIGENMFDPAAKLAYAQRPRLFFSELPSTPGQTPLQVLRHRAADPAFASIVAQIRRQGQSALDATFPPVMPNTNPPEQTRVFAEDPLRGQSDLLYWIGLAYLIEIEPAKQAALQKRLKEWISIHLDWGPPFEELPLGQSTAALATMYDWFHDDFLAANPVFRKRLKYGIVQRVRLRGDWANRRGSGRNPIAPPHYNHAWFNSIGPAMAGLALLGEHDGGLPATEIQGWIAEGLSSFSMEQALMPADGATFEGWAYQDYGHRPVFDFISNAEKILGLEGQLMDCPAMRNRSNRAFFVTPALGRDYIRYGDGLREGQRFGSPYHLLAKRYRDERAQRVAVSLTEGDPNEWTLIASTVSSGHDFHPAHWRSLFWYDPSLAPVPWARLPLFFNGNDYGMHSARSSWAADGSASAIALRCGLSTGRTALAVWNGANYYNNHAFPAVGHVTFFDGPIEVLPTTDWLGVKWSGYFNVAGVAPRDGQQSVNNAQTKNILIGQVNELVQKMPLVDGPPYADNVRAPRVISARNTPRLHTYLMEFGGLYKLTDNRNTTGDRRTTYPVYHRRVVYMPERHVVVICDRIRTFYPRSVTYLVPTRAVAPKLGEGTVDFETINTSATSGRTTAQPYDGWIVYFSPTPGRAAIAATSVPTNYDKQRQTLSYTPDGEVTESRFGFAIGRKANLAGLGFAIVADHLTITGLPEGLERLPLTDETVVSRP